MRQRIGGRGGIHASRREALCEGRGMVYSREALMESGDTTFVARFHAIIVATGDSITGESEIGIFWIAVGLVCHSTERI